MQQQTETGRTVDVSLYVVSEMKDGWRVRSPDGEGRGVYLADEWAFRLSPARVQPARFRMPRWLWAKLTEAV